jgi:hypothetical protein
MPLPRPNLLESSAVFNTFQPPIERESGHIRPNRALSKELYALQEFWPINELANRRYGCSRLVGTPVSLLGVQQQGIYWQWTLRASDNTLRQRSLHRSSGYLFIDAPGKRRKPQQKTQEAIIE